MHFTQLQASMYVVIGYGGQVTTAYGKVKFKSKVKLYMYVCTEALFS